MKKRGGRVGLGRAEVFPVQVLMAGLALSSLPAEKNINFVHAKEN